MDKIVIILNTGTKELFVTIDVVPVNDKSCNQIINNGV